MKKQTGADINEESSIEEQIKQLVIARIDAYSDDLNISAGDSGSLTKKQLIESVEKGDELGKQITEAHMTFLRDLASGKIYENE